MLYAAMLYIQVAIKFTGALKTQEQRCRLHGSKSIDPTDPNRQ